MNMPSSIPLRRDATTDHDSLGFEWSGAGVGLLLLLVVVVLWAGWRKRAVQPEKSGTSTWRSLLARPSRRGNVEVVTSARLTPRHSLHEVHWNGRRLLIGCAEQSIAMLGEASLDVGTEPSVLQEKT